MKPGDDLVCAYLKPKYKYGQVIYNSVHQENDVVLSAEYCLEFACFMYITAIRGAYLREQEMVDIGSYFADPALGKEELQKTTKVFV